jgi:CheY-like chemotaxis protein
MAGQQILLVEDDDDAADAMAAVLQSNGYAIVRATDGEEALRALRAGVRPCVILLDLFMTGMDGVEFRRVQCADPRIGDIPVVVVSGIANMLANVDRLGVVRCFQKPVDIDELLGVVNELCLGA